MTERIRLKTCKEHGFPAEGLDDWYFAGRFGIGFRDQADLLALVHFITSQFGPHACMQIERRGQDSGRLREMYLLVPPVEEIVAFTVGHLEVAVRGEHISDEIFWELVEPVLQAAWEQASLGERLRLVAEADAPPSAVMDKVVHPDVSTLLYRGLEI